LAVLLTLALCLNSSLLVAAEEVSVTVNEQELLVQRYPASGKQLIIWVAPSWGSRDRSLSIVDALGKAGVEVWHVDLLESLFLQRSSRAMRSLQGDYIAELIRYAHQQSGKSIILLSRSYGAVPLLRGAREWQLRHRGEHYLKGAIIFSPDLYQGAPALGEAPQYLPIVDATNIPLAIFQGAKRGNRWQIESLVKRLETGGAAVFVKIMPEVNSVFFEPSRAELAKEKLAQVLHQLKWTLALLEKMPQPEQAVTNIAKAASPIRSLDDKLKPYSANPVPKLLSLVDVNGKTFRKSDYKNQVTVVNFWATWCRPCVKEIPSLNNLRRKMKGKKFELVSVNYAESRKEILDFMLNVNVDFPVLMDSDGRVSASWQVVVFPSTFVVGPDGLIVYGANAGLEWDDKEIVDKITGLLPTE